MSQGLIPGRVGNHIDSIRVMSCCDEAAKPAKPETASDGAAGTTCAGAAMPYPVSISGMYGTMLVVTVVTMFQRSLSEANRPSRL